MRLSYRAVRRWLEANALSCSAEELHTLASIADQAIPLVEKRHRERQQKLDQIAALAREAGLDEEEVARLVNSKSDRQSDERRPRTGVRRPYMNPFDAHSGIYAFPPNHPEKIPHWAKQALNKGWTKEEMHYKNLAGAWARRNMSPLYDPVARHGELQAVEAAKGGYQRKKRQ